MFLSLSGFATLASAFKLVVLLIIFFALLIGAHLFTKWYAKSNYINTKSTNISIVESQQIAQGKSIVIARVGEKYVSFILMKENAEFLTELTEEELVFQEPKVQNLSFRDVLKKAKHSRDNDDL